MVKYQLFCSLLFSFNSLLRISFLGGAIGDEDVVQVGEDLGF